MSKLRSLIEFLTIGFILSSVALFVGNLFGFSLGINFDSLFRILTVFLLLTLLVNLKNIKEILGSSTVLNKFLLLTGLNIFVFVLFLLFYPIFRFGSPLVFEDRIPNFKASQKKEIVLGEPIRQSFLAKSNNLGTIGLKIISEDIVVGEQSENINDGEIASESGSATVRGQLKEVPKMDENEQEKTITEQEEIKEDNINVELVSLNEIGEEQELNEELSLTQPVKIIFQIREEKESDNNLTDDVEKSSILLGLPIQEESREGEHVFETKVSSSDYLYENTYELTSGFETRYFLFGFPIQKDSKDKKYVFEIEKIGEGQTDKVFLIERNSQGNFNFYPRYVYSLKEFKSNYQPILSNISRKTNQFLEEKNNQVNLIIVFLLIEIFIISFLKKEEKFFKEKIFPVFKWIFFLCLLSMIIFSLNFGFFKNHYLQRFFNLLASYNLLLIFLTIIFGLLAYFFSKEKIEFQNDRAIGKKLTTDYRMVSNFRTTIKDKSGWGYVFGLTIIIISGIFLRLNNIKYLSIWYDEGISISVAKNIANGLGNILINGSSYGRAYLYHKYLSYFFQFSGEFWIGIIANIPFFIISSIFLYFFGKELLNRKTGLFASFLFSFSWVAIAMAREVRFYEMFICLFLIGSYFLYKTLKDYFKNKENFFKSKTLTFRLLSYLLFSITFFLFSLHIHPLTYFILYALFIMGVTLYFLKLNKNGALITILSLILVALGQLYKYKELRFLLEYDMPGWFTRLYEPAGYFEFIKELFFHGYFYLPIVVGFLIFFMIKENKLAITFLFSIFFGLYTMISIQGTGEISFLRYYYFIFPFIFLLIGYVIFSIKNSKLRLLRIIYYLLLITATISSLYTGVQESQSALYKTSRYELRNIPNKKILQLVHNEIYKDYKIISTNLFAFESFLYTGENITNFLYERDLANTKFKEEKHTRVRAIAYNELVNMINQGEKIIFIDDTRRFQLMRYDLSVLLNRGERIFEQKINSKVDKISVIVFN